MEVLTQSDIDSMRGWCVADHMKRNVGTSKVIVFTGKRCAFNCNCRLCDECVTRTDCIGDPEVRVDCKLRFIAYATYVSSQPLKMLVLVFS